MGLGVQTPNHAHVDQIALMAAKEAGRQIFDEIVQLCGKTVTSAALGRLEGDFLALLSK